MHLLKTFLLTTTLLWVITPGLSQTVVAQDANQPNVMANVPIVGELFSANSVRQITALNVRFLGFGPMDESAKAAIKEDCAIFNHLVSQSIPLQGQRASLGVNVTSAFGPNEAIYLDGTGLVFTYHVGFPVAPFQKQEPDASGRNATDDTSEWERARQQLKTRNSNRLVRNGGVELFSVADVRSMMYEAERVNDLKNAMVKTMAQVTNFRNLNSDDTITVYVYGPGIENQDKTVLACRVEMSAAGNVETVQYVDKRISAHTQAGFLVNPSSGLER